MHSLGKETPKPFAMTFHVTLFYWRNPKFALGNSCVLAIICLRSKSKPPQDHTSNSVAFLLKRFILLRLHARFCTEEVNAKKYSEFVCSVIGRTTKRRLKRLFSNNVIVRLFSTLSLRKSVYSLSPSRLQCAHVLAASRRMKELFVDVYPFCGSPCTLGIERKERKCANAFQEVAMTTERDAVNGATTTTRTGINKENLIEALRAKVIWNALTSTANEKSYRTNLNSFRANLMLRENFLIFAS